MNYMADNQQIQKMIPDNRMEHMHGVAEYCYKHATDDFYKLDRTHMYILGLLHDCGYIQKKAIMSILEVISLRNLDIRTGKKFMIMENF